MRDEDRLVAAIEDLTNQVARVAWALESTRMTAVYQHENPCSKCGSQLVLANADDCPACLEPKKEKVDG